MTIAYSINGGSEIPGILSNWQRTPLRENDDGSIEYTSLAVNTWQAPQMTVANYLTLQALRGAAPTSLETNDIDDRNTGAAYSDSVILIALKGRQTGHIMTDVEAVFEVET